MQPTDRRKLSAARRIVRLTISKVPLKQLGSLRSDFLTEINCQFTYDKCHLYGWADTYLIRVDDVEAGYGGVWGKDKREDRDSIMEYYLRPHYRYHATTIFSELVKRCGATYIEAQSNDPSLTSMLFEFGVNIYAESILFDDAFTSHLKVPGATLVASDGDRKDVDRPYQLMHDGQVVGTGGLLLNYNFPYADIYYGIDEAYRRKGFGAFMVQELKKEAYRMNRVPAARTNIGNAVSKRTMMKAGLKVCGWRIGGTINEKKVL